MENIMLKAVFIDYTGTIIKEGGAFMQEIIMRVYKNSSLDNPNDAVAVWWKLLKKYEEHCYLESYINEDEIVDRALADCVEQISLNDDLGQLHSLFQKFWIHAPLFSDAREFFEKCTLPIYIITNNGTKYVEESMKEKNLNYSGIISSDMVRAYKPHQEIFEKALEISECKPSEVIHIGDSYSSDALGAMSAGIRPVLIDRNGGKEYDNITVVRSLTEVIDYLGELN